METCLHVQGCICSLQPRRGGLCRTISPFVLAKEIFRFFFRFSKHFVLFTLISAYATSNKTEPKTKVFVFPYPKHLVLPMF